MDVDPVTDDEEVALLAYEAMIGNEFELTHGWHVNLMPRAVLPEFSADWDKRATEKSYGSLIVRVPSPDDLLAHWENARHPGKARFERPRALIIELMEAPVEQLDAVAARHAISLRGAIREIPVAFGQFWESAATTES